MQWLRNLLIGLLGVTGGILGNLIAAIIEGSLGQTTLYQIGLIIIGTFLAIALAVTIEQKWPRDNIKQLQELEQHRRELHRLESLHYGGVLWTSSHVRAWLDHQSAIAEIKGRLRDKDVRYDRIDYVPPPKLGYLARVIEFIKQNPVVMLPVLFSFAFLLSPGAQYCYLNYVATPTPIPIPTDIPTPAPVDTPIPMPTNTPTNTPIVTLTYTPTSVLPTPTPLPPTDTLTPSPTSTLLATSTPTYIPAGTPPTPISANTPTPWPTLLPPPALLNPEGDSFIGPVLLSWYWDRSLTQDEFFALRVRKEEEIEPCHHSQVQEPKYWGDLPNCSAGKLYWYVSVVRQLCRDCPIEEQMWEELTEQSWERSIYYWP
jgi:hypothetical protein